MNNAIDKGVILSLQCSPSRGHTFNYDHASEQSTRVLQKVLSQTPLDVLARNAQPAIPSLKPLEVLCVPDTVIGSAADGTHEQE